jgi:NADH-quinone oxidoreductase subunit E
MSAELLNEKKNNVIDLTDISVHAIDVSINPNNAMYLSEKTIAIIDEWLKKYPADKKRSVILTALHAAQEQNEGWLSEAIMKAVAHYLEIPHIQVYEVATFYDMYDLKPSGRHKIRVCTNVSCMLRGADKIVEQLEKSLNIKCGDSTPDGQFKLIEAECLAACVDAPVMQINTEYHRRLTSEKVEKILAQWREPA